MCMNSFRGYKRSTVYRSYASLYLQATCTLTGKSSVTQVAGERRQPGRLIFRGPRSHPGKSGIARVAGERRQPGRLIFRGPRSHPGKSGIARVAGERRQPGRLIFRGPRFRELADPPERDVRGPVLVEPARIVRILPLKDEGRVEPLARVVVQGR